MKKIIVIIFCFLVVIIPVKNTKVLYCEEEQEAQFQEEIEKQINNLDLTDIESIINDLDEKELNIFGSSSFWTKLKDMINGEYSQDSGSVLQTVVNLLFDDILKYVPLMAIVIAVAVIFSMVSQMKTTYKKSSIGDILHFICYSIIIILIMTSVFAIIKMTTETIGKMNSQMQVIFPILLTMLTAVGGHVSVSVFQPTFALLSSGLGLLFSKILLPIFIFSLIFTILSNLTTSVKLNNFASFFSSLFKWILGFLFTVFFAFVSIQGISAGTFDSISFKTAKYTLKSSIPLIGGYLSDGFNLIVASSVLIKNAVGASGLLLLFATIIVPILNLIIFMFCLKLTSAILEPLTDSRISNFVSGISKSITMLLSIVLGIAFIYLLMTGLVMCSANFS